MDLNQKRTLIMSNKEANRIAVIDRITKREVKQIKAASILQLSTRQIRRLTEKYRQMGASGLIHGNRGCSGNRAIDQKIINNVLEIIKNKYLGFGPTLAYEKLREANQISFGLETLRKAMIDRGLWQEKIQKKIIIHQLRDRRKSLGEMVQIDGSPHRWFEDRGEACTLLVFIDDATGKLLWLEFCHSETTMAYFRATKGYVKQHGKPLFFYSDRDSVFRTSGKEGEIYQPTQFARAMNKLSITIICATTPQAKGRVERVNQTLQDRLVKELRLRNISTMEDGNKFLPKFMAEFNRKFAVTPTNNFNAHRPLTEIENKTLDQILAVIEERTLSKNLTCQFNSQFYQIKSKTKGYGLRQARVKIIQDTDNQIQIEYKNKKLDYTIFNNQLTLINQTEIIGSKLINHQVDKIVSKQSWKPESNHPWRRFTYGHIS
jgi:transposase